MEDLKEMFAQMMRFQRESEQKTKKNNFNFNKKKEERLFQLLQGNKEKEEKTRKNNNGSSLNYKNNKKHFFKSLSNNQPTDSTVVFTQMLYGMLSKHLSTHKIKIKPSRHITEDMKISILPTVPIEIITYLNSCLLHSFLRTASS